VRIWYNHINFNAKAKGAVSCKLFFAEVIFMRGQLPVCCLCLVTPTDDGNQYSYLNSAVEVNFCCGDFTLCNFLLFPDLLSS
jgi:hypothetical protein